MVNKDVLTSQFLSTLTPIGLKFAKSIPKPRKNMYDYAKKAKTRKLLKLKRPTTRVKRKKLPSIKSLKNKADLVFGTFIKNRDKWVCQLCGSKTNIQCGHLIKRGKMSTRYDEINCHALCSGCNYKDNFEPWHYASWFIFENSDIAYQALINKSKGLVKANREFFLEVIKKYENNPTKD